MAKPWCKNCGHHAHSTGDCSADGCGCIKSVEVDLAAREARKRTWIVIVKFMLKNRWTPACEIRVKAAGLAGAAMHGLREAKRLHVKPRSRIVQTELCVLPVPRGSR